MKLAELAAIRAHVDAVPHGPWRWGDWSAQYGTLEDRQRMTTLEYRARRTFEDLARPDVFVWREVSTPEPILAQRHDFVRCILRLEEPPDNQHVADFIAGSGTWVPGLLDEVETLREALRTACQIAQHHIGINCTEPSTDGERIQNLLTLVAP